MGNVVNFKRKNKLKTGQIIILFDGKDERLKVSGVYAKSLNKSIKALAVSTEKLIDLQ